MSRTITPNDLKPLLARDKDVVLLDIRRKNDYDADPVKVPGAAWYDPNQVAEWSAQLPRDKDTVLYCVRGGSVSNAVVDALRALGINARFIEGGIEGWKQAGEPTVAKA